MARFFERMFDAKIIFRGRMLGEPFVRIIANGITYVFRQQTDFKDPGPDFALRNHPRLRVSNLDEAVAALNGRGANFALDPNKVKETQKQRTEGDRPMLEMTCVAEPLALETLAESGYKNDVAMFEAPDHLYIELNEVELPPRVDWF